MFPPTTSCPQPVPPVRSFAPMRSWLVACFLFAFAAFAETGDGSAGDFTVSGTTVVNRYGPLRASVEAGARTLETTPGLVGAGDLVLLLTAQSATPLPNDGDTIRVDDANVGRFATARVEAMSGSTITLTAPLERAWEATVTQVVFVPQYENLTIEAGGVIEPLPWDGQVGGVVALAVRGTLTNEGRVHADGRGFRGGRGGLIDVAPFPSELVRNGEGLLVGSWPALRNPLPDSTGGAIGRFFQAYSVTPGGGGGNATRGGKAPFAKDASGGTGGLRVSSAGERALFGGGAAATGQGSHLFTEPGGAGGGAVIVFAGAVAGAGTFSANGLAGGTTQTNGDDPLVPNVRHTAAGAGGSIVLDVLGSITCALVDASGGDGQSVKGCCAASAAGGAGRIFVTAKSLACETRAVSGLTGTFDSQQRDGFPFARLAGEVDVRELARAPKEATTPKFLLGCSVGSGELLWLSLVVLLFQRRTRNVSN